MIIIIIAILCLKNVRTHIQNNKRRIDVQSKSHEKAVHDVYIVQSSKTTPHLLQASCIYVLNLISPPIQCLTEQNAL